MRKLLPHVAAVAGTLALTGLIVTPSAVAVPTKAKPPVKLDGTVNNKGVKTLKGTTLNLEQNDFFFKSTFIKGKPGTTVQVNLENKGNAPHTFTIDGQPADQTLTPGQQATVTVTIPADGKVVNFFCRFHRSSGMQGAFYTKATSGKSNSSNSGSSGGGSNSNYGY